MNRFLTIATTPLLLLSDTTGGHDILSAGPGV
jgi:hypothetical protein